MTGVQTCALPICFAIQALCARYVAEHRGQLPVKLISGPREIDDYVARLKLETMGVKIDTLTPEQEKYLNSWQI